MADKNEAKWYVIHTYSGYENKVASDLEKMVENRNMGDLILETKIPTEKTTEIKDGVVTEKEHKVFPGYVLVKMIVTDDSWYVVRNIHGVTGFVGPASKPVPLTDEEVANLGVEKRNVSVQYEIGSLVKIIDGPLEGFEGKVEELDLQNNGVTVLISMFGRETSVSLELNQIALGEN